ncbi:MAG: polysaccharide biosynthesis protein [Clostridia bacterium]|nr:polysaccharide biosynthesis protein [Clostridia bacterium]
MQQKEFMKNATVMTVTALILRAIGIIFRIYLSGRIGAEGMGLYQLVFSVYVLLSTFASTGICTAVTRLVTDQLVCGTVRTVKQVLRRAVPLCMAVGVVSAGLIFFFAAPVCTYLIKDIRALPSLQVLGISLPFMGITACLRGYFMARRKTLLPSISQIAEQVARIGFIFLFFQLWGGNDVKTACLAVILGDGFAEILSSCIMMGGYFYDLKALKQLKGTHVLPKKYGIVQHLLEIAAPITAGRYLNSVLRTVENILVPQKLTAYGGTTQTSLEQFGMLKGMALPLLFFPSSFLSSVSTLLIPELSEAHTLGEQQKVTRAVKKALRITLLMSIWLSGLFTVFAYDLGDILYGSHDVGFLLRVLAPLMPIMYLESIVDGMLKGLNQQMRSLWYSVLDSATRILLIIALVPAKGMAGFLFIMVLSNLLTSSLNLQRLLKVTNVRMQWGEWLIRPLLAAIAAVSGWMLLQNVLSIATPVRRVVVGIGIISVIYLILSFLFGSIKKDDLRDITPHRSSASVSLTEHF